MEERECVYYRYGSKEILCLYTQVPAHKKISHSLPQ